MRVVLLCLCAVLYYGAAPGQITGYVIELGGSYTRRPENGPKTEFSYRNLVGVKVRRNWAMGMKLQHIYHKNFATADTEYMYIWGPFGRWGLSGKWVHIYFQAGINWGNYVGSTDFVNGEPSREAGILYASFDGILEARIMKGLFVEIGLSSHEILNRPQSIFGFDSYIVGLVLDLER